MAEATLRRSCRVTGTLLALVLATSGCNRFLPQATVSPSEPGERVRVEGTLTGEGLRCPAMRDGDDRLYTLSGSLGNARRGDRVVVEGTIAQTSSCQQGRTIHVTRIELIP